jgi:hypothetical protein
LHFLVSLFEKPEQILLTTTWTDIQKAAHAIHPNKMLFGFIIWWRLPRWLCQSVPDYQRWLLLTVQFDMLATIRLHPHKSIKVAKIQGSCTRGEPIRDDARGLTAASLPNDKALGRDLRKKRSYLDVA